MPRSRASPKKQTPDRAAKPELRKPSTTNASVAPKSKTSVAAKSEVTRITSVKPAASSLRKPTRAMTTKGKRRVEVRTVKKTVETKSVVLDGSSGVTAKESVEEEVVDSGGRVERTRKATSVVRKSKTGMGVVGEKNTFLIEGASTRKRSRDALSKVGHSKGTLQDAKQPKDAASQGKSTMRKKSPRKQEAAPDDEDVDMSAVPEEASKGDEKSTVKGSKKKSSSSRTRVQAPKKSPGANKYSLTVGDQPLSSEKRKPSTKSSAKRVDDGVTEVENADDMADVSFHKQMTKEKLALMATSPLSKLITRKAKDAAAEEVFGEGAKFDDLTGKRGRDASGEDDIIPLDSNAKPPTKKARNTEDELLDREALTARRKEARKLKRKVRQMRSRGELPDGEKEVPEVGVVYLGHIPHGFYEDEMRGYFSQFGEVTRLRLSRSKKTARSRGFAFVEFADKVVAAAAADSMDGYLMHGQALVAKLMPPETVHPATFKGANRVFKKIPFSAVERRGLIQRSRDPMKLALRSKIVAKKAKAKQSKLSRKGITYTFPTIPSPVEA